MMNFNAPNASPNKPRRTVIGVLPKHASAMPADPWPGDEVEIHGEVWRMVGYRMGTEDHPEATPVWRKMGRVYTFNNKAR